MHISQNRLGKETERHADLDLQIGLLTEHELTRVLQMLDAIQDKLSIVDHRKKRTGRSRNGNQARRCPG